MKNLCSKVSQSPPNLNQIINFPAFPLNKMGIRNMKGLEISENVLEQFRTVLAKLFGIMPDGYDKNRNQNVKHACSNKMPRWSNSSLLLCTPGGGGGGTDQIRLRPEQRSAPILHRAFFYISEPKSSHRRLEDELPTDSHGIRHVQQLTTRAHCALASQATERREQQQLTAGSYGCRVHKGTGSQSIVVCAANILEARAPQWVL